jgi:hypothetical protein
VGYIEMGSTEIGNKDVKWMKLLQDHVKDWVVKWGGGLLIISRV